MVQKRSGRGFAAILAAAAFAVGIGLGPQGMSFVAPARAAEMSGTLDAQAKTAIDAWINAIASGDQAKLGKVLAPDFQIVRSDGTVYDRDGYLASDLPKINLDYDVDKVAATSEGDVMVASYVLNIRETIGGKPVEHKAPRLTVFRKVGDVWQVVAHGNFATVE